MYRSLSGATKSLGQDKESEDRRTKDYCFLALCSPFKHVTLYRDSYLRCVIMWLALRSRTVHNFTFACNTNMIIHIAKQFFSRILGWVQWFCFECHTNSDKRIFIAQKWSFFIYWLIQRFGIDSLKLGTSYRYLVSLALFQKSTSRRSLKHACTQWSCMYTRGQIDQYTE